MPFRLWPDSFIAISATSSEIGIASITMIVLRTLCRKKNSTIPVIAEAISSSVWTSSTVWRT